jgi:hypothetical protein
MLNIDQENFNDNERNHLPEIETKICTNKFENN